MAGVQPSINHSPQKNMMGDALVAQYMHHSQQFMSSSANHKKSKSNRRSSNNYQSQ
jgi:hypothetical protein